MTHQDDQFCGCCRFWMEGYCHVLPPRVYPDNQNQPVTVWPTTSADDWCGKWEKAVHR